MKNHNLKSTIIEYTPAGPSGPVPVASVRVLRTLPELETLRDVWSSWKGHRDSDIDFFVEFIRTRPEVIRPHVIVLYRYGTPEAMLIGRLEHAQLTRQTFKVGYLRLPRISARILIFSQGGARGNISEANSTELVNSVTTSLGSGEADLAFLHQVDAASPLFKSAVTAVGFVIRDHFAFPEPRWTMKLPGTVEELYQGFSRRVRKEFRAKKASLLRNFEGRIRTECIQTSAELDRIIPNIEAVAEKTYQRGLGVGFADTPEIRRKLQFFAEKGWLRAYILYLDDKPCAFDIGTVHDGMFAGEFAGYDPYFRDHSVGSFIMITMIEDLCRQGVKVADFGAGQAEYKRNFSNCQTMEADIHIFAPSIKGVALNMLRTVTESTDRALKKMLERTMLLQALKKLWRNRLTHEPAKQLTN
jgi:hypothetical protein